MLITVQISLIFFNLLFFLVDGLKIIEKPELKNQNKHDRFLRSSSTSRNLELVGTDDYNFFFEFDEESSETNFSCIKYGNHGLVMKLENGVAAETSELKRIIWNECHDVVFAYFEDAQGFNYTIHPSYTSNELKHIFSINEEEGHVPPEAENKTECIQADYPEQDGYFDDEHKNKRILSTISNYAQKVIPIVLVSDCIRYLVFEKDLKRVNAMTLAVFSHMSSIFKTYLDNQSGGDYRITVILEDYIQLTPESTPNDCRVLATGGSDPYVLLATFADWAKIQPWMRKELHAILLTGVDMTGSTVGIAYLGTACDRSYAIVQSNYLEPYASYNGKILAHEFGHNLGIRHTNNYLTGSVLPTAESISDCTPQTSSVMSPIMYGSSYIWDKCSYLWFRQFIEGYPFGCKVGSCSFTGYTAPDTCYLSNKNMATYPPNVSSSTKSPTRTPSRSPTIQKTISPTKNKPTIEKTISPTKNKPTIQLTHGPTKFSGTLEPTPMPTFSSVLSESPTKNPTKRPSSKKRPGTKFPTRAPRKTRLPTLKPTKRPTQTRKPTIKPSRRPTKNPIACNCPKVITCTPSKPPSLKNADYEYASYEYVQATGYEKYEYEQKED